MKKFFYRVCALLFAVVFLCAIFAGCRRRNRSIPEAELKNIEHMGQVPEEFAAIVENNLFSEITVFEDRLLKTEILSQDEENHIMEQQVRMMDLYGRDLASYTCTADDAYQAMTLTATDDGGFLFVLGFDERYRDGQWTSEMGLASWVIKCDSQGNVQFETAFEGVEGRSLEFCFEKDGNYYFFGEVETPETKTVGVGSPSDIYMAILDQDGRLRKTNLIAGSDFDDLCNAEMVDDDFVLSIRAQSDDGDFAGSDSGGYGVSWVFTVDDELQKLQREKRSGREFSDYRMGEKDGKPVYKSDPLFDGFDAGSVQAYIDYGDFYLVVSENKTGIYENTPLWISSTWYYRETVYSAYDNSGKLIFRTAVDSSPDYDSFVSQIQELT